MRQAYLPKVSDLRAASKSYDPDEVSDQQMMDKMQAVLDAEDFARKVYDQLDSFLNSIADDMKPKLFALEQDESGKFRSNLSGRYVSPFDDNSSDTSPSSDSDE